MGVIDLFLYKVGEDSTPFYQTTLNLQSAQITSLQKISFQPQFDPPFQSYRLVLKIIQGKIHLWGKNENIYINGNAYLDQNPIQSDLGLKTSYCYNLVSLINDLYHSIPAMWLIIPTIICLLLPGWIMLTIGGIDKKFDFSGNLALSLGLSISFYAILITWTSKFDYHWNKTSILILAFLLSLAGFLQVIRANLSRNLFKIKPISLILLATFIITLMTRLIMVRDLAAPPWVDSVHHGLITQLILDNGRLPNSYNPFINLNTTSYHTGFHILSAVFIWLTDLDTHKAILLLGQILSSFAIFPIYLLSISLIRNQTSALISATLVAFILPMPAYYTSWGRYPQLVGLIMMPGIIAIMKLLIHDFADQADNRTLQKTIIICSILLAGLTLTHYRVTALLFCYIVASTIVIYIPYILNKEIRILFQNRIPYLGLVLLLSSIILIPWMPEVIRDLIFPRLYPQVAIAPFAGINPDYLTYGCGTIGIVIAAIGFFIALVERKNFLYILIIWFGLIFFIANMASLKLPGGNFINNNFVMISLFIPLSILGGYGFNRSVSIIRNVVWFSQKWLVEYAAIIILICGLIFGALNIVTILNPITFLAREADFRAMQHIQNITESQEQILINPFLWGYNLYAGADGGYWISTSARRATIPPPVIYGLSNDLNYIKKINEINNKMIQIAEQPIEIAKLMRKNHVKYLYLGARGGIISSKTILDSPLFLVRYHQDGVWLFELIK